MPHNVPCSRRQEEGPAAVVVVGRGLVALVLGGGGHGVLGDADFSELRKCQQCMDIYKSANYCVYFILHNQNINLH